MRVGLTRIKISIVYRLRVVLMKVLAFLQRQEAEATLRSQMSSSRPARYRAFDTSFSIVITTFQARQERYCTPLVSHLRNFGCDAPIVVVVNGEPNGALDPGRRMGFVRSLASNSDIHFVMFRDIVGLARLWNAGVQAAASDVCVVLNDDLLAVSADCVDDLARLASTARKVGVAIGNGSWSHFGIARSTMMRVGWFDERYLGFGEEDGDYSWRFRLAMGHYPANIPMAGLVNVKDAERSAYATGIGKYSLANRVWTSLKYSASRPQALDVEPPPFCAVDTPDFYPGETFRENYGRLLDEESEEVIRRSLINGAEPE